MYEEFEPEPLKKSDDDDSETWSFSYPSYTRFNFTGKTKSRLGKRQAYNKEEIKTNEDSSCTVESNPQAPKTPSLSWLRGDVSTSNPFTPKINFFKDSVMHGSQTSKDDVCGNNVSSQSNFLSYLKSDSVQSINCKKNLAFNSFPFNPEQNYDPTLQELNQPNKNPSQSKLMFPNGAKDENKENCHFRNQGLNFPDTHSRSKLNLVDLNNDIPELPPNLNNKNADSAKMGITDPFSFDRPSFTALVGMNDLKKDDDESSNTPLDLSSGLTSGNLTCKSVLINTETPRSDNVPINTELSVIKHGSNIANNADQLKNSAKETFRENNIAKEKYSPEGLGSILPNFLVPCSKTKLTDSVDSSVRANDVPFGKEKSSKLGLSSKSEFHLSTTDCKKPIVNPVRDISKPQESSVEDNFNSLLMPNLVQQRPERKEEMKPRPAYQENFKQEFRLPQSSTKLIENVELNTRLRDMSVKYTDNCMRNEKIERDHQRDNHESIQHQLASKPSENDNPGSSQSNQPSLCAIQQIKEVPSRKSPSQNISQTNKLQIPQMDRKPVSSSLIKEVPKQEGSNDCSFNPEVQQVQKVKLPNDLPQKTYLAPQQSLPDQRYQKDFPHVKPEPVNNRPNLPVMKKSQNNFKAPAPRGLLSRAITELCVNGKSYSVLSMLGRGGSSEVYQVLDSSSSKLLAVKCVDLSMVDNSIADGYLNEIALLSKLQGCACVIRMFDYEYLQEYKMLYVVMEKGDTDLSQLIRDINKTKKISMSMIIYYWTEMLTAVKDIHDGGIIHSDLKPANFLLVSGRLKLIDFGIASSQGDMTSVVKEVTTGTWNYMSPEAIKNTNANGRGFKITYKSDIWSLGCILYNLVYGKTPFSHITNTWGKLQAIADPSHCIEFPEVGVPAVLAGALRSCLIRDPKQRPTVTQLLALPYHATHPSPTLAPDVAHQIRDILPNEWWLKIAHLFPDSELNTNGREELKLKKDCLL